MKIKSIVILLACLLILSSLTMPAIACDCEGDPPAECYQCEGGVWVQYGDCWDGCPDCEECVDCYCECTSDCGCGGKTCTGCCECESCSCADKNDNCTGECHNGCSGCSCVDDESKCPGECDTCDDGTCTDHDYECNWRLCETCNDGECEDRCPALGKYCDYDTGMCEECVIVSHCELCEECIHHECKHPCDECVYPEYCGAACSCVECYPGTDDTTTCSGTNIEECTGCSMNPISPCSGAVNNVVYTNNSLTTCTGPDCETRWDVLCYTTYVQCAASGLFIPLLWCSANSTGPDSCQIEDLPGPGCISCAPDPYEEGDPTYESRGVCPPEDWP